MKGAGGTGEDIYISIFKFAFEIVLSTGKTGKTGRTGKSTSTLESIDSYEVCPLWAQIHPYIMPTWTIVPTLPDLSSDLPSDNAFVQSILTQIPFG